MNYHWNWNIFFEASPDGSGTYLYTLYLGLRWTIATAMCAWVIALILGAVIGVMRTMPSRGAQRVGRVWVEVFRNVPLLMQLFLWYFVLPEMLPDRAGEWLKQLPNAPFFTAVIGIGFYMSARVAEQVRSGIGAISRGQRYAGMALGLSTIQTYRYVLLPMAVRIILPPLTSDFLSTIKNTSVALTIGLVELTSRAYAIQEQSYQFFEAFTVVTLTYLLLNTAVTAAMRRLERKFAVPGYIVGK
ncbi:MULTISPECIES: amino acid ABC transporter permease [unclassified Cupriavidus]|uniref:amino acid ABC transporter permease n=1 Tax=unclassified Cupriavidus TaxID=2640874 RepID=UPI001C0034AC|nr:MULTISPECIES: amino acid ABC transporter permease [unclassified Cupriavidus]MCA3183503.1 amino acid ABC transporter permease [Cupriavidus sp.]MCA3189131.1 amino acid ABC transporter permease [Cupriavidus sp.]MCA3198851.1 amino acid ABC transporter permease [Cupriavidus sp.]MCA3201595.1 amino acid ABC transporter permease [Cupriavidus sp.]MCA3231269.1 amino acid ABC transporter permease [Cupriavidus sp.]